MGKTLCELKKALKHDFDSYVLLVCRPRFVCKDCGRAANKKKYLCHPIKIEGLPAAEPCLEWGNPSQKGVMAIEEPASTN